MEALDVMLSIVSLLFIATGVFALARKTTIPYTVLLVLVGLILIPISKTSTFDFFQSFSLTPGLLFFVFLPTLIFESAYNMNIRNVLGCFRSISLLAIVSLLISSFFIAWVLEYASIFIGFPIPFAVTLLFGTLISATDPVAVLSLFKEYGAPKRLSLIFEGESLFNDGTSLALFLIVLEILTKGSGEGFSLHLGTEIINGTIMFTVMVLGGIALGVIMGALFSKLIQQVHDNELIEITLTMVVAHFTFILSEVISHNVMIGGHHVYLSSIIATVVAAIMVGNYGRYKISPSVVEYMEHFWGYFAFVANSIIFILIGLLFASLPISLMDILPITIVTITVVAVGRAISIYPVVGFLNLLKKEAHIPSTWSHLLAWGSLRGALAVTMVLLIPDTLTIDGWAHDFTVKEFIIALTIACIYFTLFVKGLTIGPMLKYFKLQSLNTVEMGEYHEATALLYAKLLLEVERFMQKGYITKEIYDQLRKKYLNLYHVSCVEGQKVFTAQQDVTSRVLVIFALATAKHSLKTLFIHNEVSESVYKKILTDLTIQLEQAEESPSVIPMSLKDFSRDWLDMLHDAWGTAVGRPVHSAETLHMFYRAHSIIMHKAGEEIKSLAASNLEIFENKNLFTNIIEKLSALEIAAKVSAEEVATKHPEEVAPLALAFAEAGLQKARHNIVELFAEREVISPKVRALLVDDIAKSKTAQ
jgi:CPA1 family monovalent cation:H+ antiporter